MKSEGGGRVEGWMKNILGIKYLINLLNKWASVALCKAQIAAACQLWMDMSSNFGTVSRFSSGSTSLFFVIRSHSSTTIHVSIERTSLKYMKKYMYVCTLSAFTLNCNEFYMH